MKGARLKGAKGESGKTISNKAIKSGRASAAELTPRSSPFASLRTSPAHSAAPSRQVSDMSESEDWDALSESTYSSNELEAEEPRPTFDVNMFMEMLQDRKHHNSESRELLIEAYIKTLRNFYNPETHEWLDDKATELCQLFLRSANRGMTARERLFSLQAFVLTLATSEEADIFEEGQVALRQIITDEDDEECEVFAMYAMIFAVLYGGGSEEGAQEVLTYLTEIINSDGEVIDAHNNALVVTGALQSWSFVASHVEDLSDAADLALDSFVEQLDSDDVHVQTHAASCIALVYEASRHHEEEAGEPFSLSYDPQRLINRFNELIKQSNKSISKKDRKILRDSLSSVITSLERRVGPGYSVAGFAPDKRNGLSAAEANDDGVVEFGYRLKLRLGNNIAPIDSWSLALRVDMIKLLFGGHLQKHMFVNPVVTECLSDADFSAVSSATKAAPKPSKRPAPKNGKR
ncbi:interferon-related developmental regulator-domain-containing protein [Mariannaea sp. PMI_226]|nr:interferon-related developmental regulator-domain-containing protein [Mariannaea sp. PMI_226]